MILYINNVNITLKFHEKIPYIIYIINTTKIMEQNNINSKITYWNTITNFNEEFANMFGENIMVEFIDPTNTYNISDYKKKELIEKMMLGTVIPRIAFVQKHGAIQIISGAKYYKIIKSFINNEFALTGRWIGDVAKKAHHELSFPMKRKFNNIAISICRIYNYEGVPMETLLDLFAE